MIRPWLGAALFAMIPLSAIAMTWLPQETYEQIIGALSDLMLRWVAPVIFVLIFANIGYRLFKADRR